MILVMTGTNCPPFDRLLDAVESLGEGEPVVVQHGPCSVRPKNARCVEYLSFGELVGLIREARCVVTHAGVGSILVTLANGKRPLVVPRVAALGENVDDHQIELAERLGREGIVAVLEDPARLKQAVEDAAREPAASNGVHNGLVEELRTYILEGVAAS